MTLYSWCQPGLKSSDVLTRLGDLLSRWLIHRRAGGLGTSPGGSLHSDAWVASWQGSWLLPENVRLKLQSLLWSSFRNHRVSFPQRPIGKRVNPIPWIPGSLGGHLEGWLPQLSCLLGLLQSGTISQISFSSMNLTLVKSIGQLFCRVSLSFDISDVLSWLLWGYSFGRRIKQKWGLP